MVISLKLKFMIKLEANMNFRTNIGTEESKELLSKIMNTEIIRLKLLLNDKDDEQ